MKFSNASNHLTSIEKKAIKAMFEAKIFNAKVGRKIYRLSQIEANQWRVVITENLLDVFGKISSHANTITFDIN